MADEGALVATGFWRLFEPLEIGDALWSRRMMHATIEGARVGHAL